MFVITMREVYALDDFQEEYNNVCCLADNLKAAMYAVDDLSYSAYPTEIIESRLGEETRNKFWCVSTQGGNVRAVFGIVKDYNCCKIIITAIEINDIKH